MEIQDVVQIEKMELVESNDLHSKILFLQNKSLGMIILNFKDDKEKHLMRKKSLELLKSINADRYWFSSTAWFLTQDREGNNLYRRPSRDANRKECFMVTEFRKDRKNKVYFAEIKRDIHNKVTFIEDEEMNKNLNSQNNLQSYWDAWADEEFLDFDTSKMINENNEKFLKNSVNELVDRHKEELDNIQTPEDLFNVTKKIITEFQEKLKEQDKTLLEDPEEFED